MRKPSGKFSASGVLVADDFRDNLIIDRYDPVFSRMRASKITHLRSENSEDAISWNVFRSLRQISPELWLPHIAEVAFGGEVFDQIDGATVELWKDVFPPLSLLREGDEGISEIDICIESADWVWFIEAKYTSDISVGTTTRSDRDQVLRNIDVGSFYAGRRDFYFALLCLDDGRSPKGVAAVEEYKDMDYLRARLPHRRDPLDNVRQLGVIYWSDLAELFFRCRSAQCNEYEAMIVDRAVTWLEGRGIRPNNA